MLSAASGNNRQTALQIGAINLRWEGIFEIFVIFVISMEKTLITDRRAVYEKPEVESFDLSMEQAILMASPDFNPFNPEETW